MLRFPQPVFLNRQPARLPSAPAPTAAPMPRANPYLNGGQHMAAFTMPRQAYGSNAFAQPPVLHAPPMPTYPQPQPTGGFASHATMRHAMPQQAPVYHAVHPQPAVEPSARPLRSVQRNAHYDHLAVGQLTLSNGDRRSFPVLDANGQPTRSMLVIDNPQSHHAAEQALGNLATLEERGFPVQPTHSMGTYQGHPARIVANMVDIDMNSNILNSPYTSARTLKNLEFIRHQMDAQNITIHGLRLCMNPETGAVYIREASGLSAGRPAPNMG